MELERLEAELALKSDAVAAKDIAALTTAKPSKQLVRPRHSVRSQSDQYEHQQQQHKHLPFVHRGFRADERSVGQEFRLAHRTQHA